MHMRESVAFKMMLILPLIGILCSSVQPNTNLLIKKEMLVHTITNKNLKKCIVDFDNKFRHYEESKGRWIVINCWDVCPDSIRYTISYCSGINYEFPIVFCESVNGRPVVMRFPGIYGDVSLNAMKSIELLKTATPDEYEMHKKKSTDIMLVMFDFVGLDVMFDREHNVLRLDTLGFYRK